MIRVAIAVTFLLSGAVMAQPRLAVHPLELGNFPIGQEEALKAQFQVMVARVTGVRLAGSARIDDALRKADGARCDTDDSCLRFLAEATDSPYALYARLDLAPTGIIATARVVRSDGVTARKVRIEAESAREALAQTVTALKLDALDSTVAPGGLSLAELSLPPFPAAEPPQPQVLEMTLIKEPATDWKRVTGWSLVGVGGVTLATGAIFGGLAASAAAENRPNAMGVVSREHVAGAATALDRSRVSAVLIPVGAVVAGVGALVVLWPSPSERKGLSLRVVPNREGLTASISGSLP